MEQSSAPWRVFDAPEAGKSSATSAPSASRRLGEAPSGTVSVAGTNQRLAIAGVLGAVAIGGLAVVIAASGAGGEVVAGPEAAVGAVASHDAALAGEIVVDVAGAVVKPGVYRLGTGARVADAIEAAGGFSPRVDVGRVGAELNLAAALTDGAQVRVPSRDDAPSSGSGGIPGSGSPGALVDLNTATEAELDALPGIGPVTAGKIIKSRAGSPFRKVSDLRERGLVGEKTLRQLEPLVTVG